MKLDETRADIEEALRASLSSSTAPKKLVEAMSYSLLAGGKRVRPLLVLASASSIDGTKRADAMNAALAVEYVHTYSLIHDDLPALDDDDVRRGRPSLHRAFDEATAILAGDALLTDAFALLAAAPTNAGALVRELATAAGSAGMVGGQVDDVDGGRDLAALSSIHARKTGALFVASCAMGALAAGAGVAQVERLRAFGRHFGLAFQIADDVLDVTTGRGRDEANEKTTFATLLGLDEARRRAHAEAAAATAIATELGSPALGEIVDVTANRER